MDCKGPRSPKQIATVAVCDPIFHLLPLLLGRDPCGDRILRSCLQKGPATALANYVWGQFGVTSSIAARKAEQEGRNPAQGSRGLAPLRGLGVRPIVSVIRGLGNPFPEAPKSLQLLNC